MYNNCNNALKSSDSFSDNDSLFALYEAARALFDSACDTGLRVLRNEIFDGIDQLVRGSITLDGLRFVERITAKGATVRALYAACLESGALHDAIVANPTFLEAPQVLQNYIVRNRKLFSEKMREFLTEIQDEGTSFSDAEPYALPCAADIGEYKAQALHILKILYDYCRWVIPEHEAES